MCHSTRTTTDARLPNAGNDPSADDHQQYSDEHAHREADHKHHHVPRHGAHSSARSATRSGFIFPSDCPRSPDRSFTHRGGCRATTDTAISQGPAHHARSIERTISVQIVRSALGTGFAKSG